MRPSDLLPTRCPACDRVLLPSEQYKIKVISESIRVKCDCGGFSFKMLPIFYVLSETKYTAERLASQDD